MVWVYIALAIPCLFCLLAFLCKFKLAVEWHSPAAIEATARFSFLGFRREIELSRADWIDENDDREDEAPVAEAAPVPEDPVGRTLHGQAGFLLVPSRLSFWLANLKRHFRRAAVRFALDLSVWRALFKYTSQSGRRVLGLLHPRLEYLHVGMEDVVTLGGFAAAWSSLQGIFPGLAAPVEYGFNERPASVKMKLASRFTGWDILVFGVLTLFSFPWIRLASRFIHCWRNPRLSLWQRRLLLF